jgi:enterochelin esterase family protein
VIRTARWLPALFTISTVVQAQGLKPIPYRMDPRVPASAKRLEHATIFDSAYKRQRDIWIYTPAGYDAKATTPYPLIVAFDGLEYRDTMPLPFILDTLLATKAAPPSVAVLLDDGEGATRIADLGNSRRMVDFLSRQLIPYVRARWRVTTDPHRVIVTGSSAGGLGAAFVALTRPDLFGNVLSQSGAFWRGAEASNGEPYEWLTNQVLASPRKDVRFYMDVGEYEDHATLGGSGPNFLAANRRLRDALLAKGYRVTYVEIPKGMHAPQYWMTTLPSGILELFRP